MRTSPHPARFPIGVSLLLAALGCGAAKPPAPQAPAARPSRAVHGSASIKPAGLYAADEALRDALSGPWEYVGTGPWPGIRRLHACAFRNARVLVVNVYCSIKETQAFRVDVYSPSRGRVRNLRRVQGSRQRTHPPGVLHLQGRE